MTKKKMPARKKPSHPMPRSPHQRERVFSRFEKPSLTEQSNTTCDLKEIMYRYTQTGQLPPASRRGEPQYLDCPDQEHDFQHAQQTMAGFKSQYESLPENVKAQFKDASEFMSYLLSQENEEQVPEGTQEEISSPEDTEALAEGAEGTSEASPDV